MLKEHTQTHRWSYIFVASLVSVHNPFSCLLTIGASLKNTWPKSIIIIVKLNKTPKFVYLKQF